MVKMVNERHSLLSQQRYLFVQQGQVMWTPSSDTPRRSARRGGNMSVGPLHRAVGQGHRGLQ